MMIAEAEQRRYVSHMEEVVTVRIWGSQQGLLPLLSTSSIFTLLKNKSNIRVHLSLVG